MQMKPLLKDALYASASASARMNETTYEGNGMWVEIAANGLAAWPSRLQIL